MSGHHPTYQLASYRQVKPEKRVSFFLSYSGPDKRGCRTFIVVDAGILGLNRLLGPAAIVPGISQYQREYVFCGRTATDRRRLRQQVWQLKPTIGVWHVRALKAVILTPSQIRSGK